MGVQNNSQPPGAALPVPATNSDSTSPAFYLPRLACVPANEDITLLPTGILNLFCLLYFKKMVMIIILTAAIITTNIY